MGMPKNPAAYYDVQQILDAALASGYARYRLKTPGAATHWRQRAYSFRRVLFDLECEKYAAIPGHTPSTPYDRLALRVEGNEVVIFLKDEDRGELVDRDGNPLQPAEAGALSGDDLDVARRVAHDLDLDIDSGNDDAQS